jgi:hypothetical protein
VGAVHWPAVAGITGIAGVLAGVVIAVIFH